MRFRGFGSGIPSTISDESLDVREWLRYGVLWRTSDVRSSSVRETPFSRRNVMVIGLAGSRLIVFVDPCDSMFAFVLPLLLLNSSYCIALVSFMLKFGCDMWKLRLGSANGCAGFLKPSLSMVVAVETTRFSWFSGIEFWLGGRGAARFFRWGATGGAALRLDEAAAAAAAAAAITFVLSTPAESIELSELVELYGDVVLAYWRLEFRLLKSDDNVNDSRLFWCSRILSVWILLKATAAVSKRSFLSDNRISFNPTSPMVKCRPKTCVPSRNHEYFEVLWWEIDS